MKRWLLIGFALSALGACATGPGGRATAPGAETPRPVARPGADAVPPPVNATTAEGFDTTTDEQRAAAAAGAEAVAGRLIGTTVATLGNPADPGFWLETPLVDAAGPGRVVAANGEAVLVDLRPIDGDAGAGSRISLAALRLLGVGLTGLHELQVYAL